MVWNFQDSYTKLPSIFYSKVNPENFSNKKLVLFNSDLARDLNLDFSKYDDDEKCNILLGKNKLNKNYFSQAYAGHQFGNFTILGDGRAVIIGEHITNNKQRVDIQLKGSGQTPYSRNGDGKAALGPMIREYILSEAMHNLGISSTRALAVITTGENVLRDRLEPGAILIRVANSHIRVGTFQFGSLLKNREEFQNFISYTISRLYPDIDNNNDKYLKFYETICDLQIKLVVDWMRVGFIHGVMNTDNMTISGETIDYGPCAFMDHYDPKTVFSSIDKFGRYSYSNQPPIAKWNLARFAECLIPIIDSNEDKAINIATEIIDNFQKIYEYKWLNMMRDKLGLFGEDKNDKNLIKSLMDWMSNNKADYTNTFCYLMGVGIDDKIYEDMSFKKWVNEWKVRSRLNNSNNEKQLQLMRKVNPNVIPRNHKVEEALSAAEHNNFDVMNKLLSVLKNPYDTKDISEYQSPAPLTKEKYKTFCGT